MNPLAKVSSWARTHRAAAAGVGIAGAAGLALVTRRRGGGDAGGAAQGQAFVTGDPAGIANDVTRSIQPQIDTLANRVGSITTSDPTTAAQLATTTEQLGATKQKLSESQATAHARQSLITRLRRQAVVRADVSKVRTKADVALLTPTQRRDFERYITAQSQRSPTQTAKALAAVPPKPKPLTTTKAAAK
jgi:hypothetical protein